MGQVIERVTGQSRQLSGTILQSISGLVFVVVFCSFTNGILVQAKVSPGTQRGRGATGQGQEFYISLSTGERDQPGLSTLVVAGSNRFMFDCGVVGTVPGGDTTPPPAATALFLTHLAATTADGADRARRDACAASPLRIWGPPGTREWMLHAAGDRALEDGQHWPVSVIELREGVVSETGNVTVAAIETAPSRFAYRVGFESLSVLIASDVTYSEHLVARSQGIDIAVLRHSDVTETATLLQRITPRLAVLSPDGLTATVAQIRQHYRGAIQLFGAGTHRVYVREQLSLDDDIKGPQR
jgi:hypothetical protein